MKKGKYINQLSEERGMALIMTLGVLAMLLVLALAFASSARTERKVAAANADAKKAQLIAEGALDRVIALANYKTLGEVCNFYGDEAYQDWISNIRTKTSSGEIIYGPSDPSSVTNAAPNGDNIKWNNVKVNNEIVGRFAYKIVGMPAWIDPAACVEQGSGPRLEGSFTEDRYGKFVNEINLNNLDPGNSTISNWTSIVPYFSSNNVGVGQLPDSQTTPAAIEPGTAQWGDFDTMCTAVGLSGTAKEQARNWFDMNTDPDPEAFWIDDNNDGVRDDSTELYHRFDMVRYTDTNFNTLYDTSEPIWWDDPDGNGDVTDNVALLTTANRAAYDSSPTVTEANTGGINWFKKPTDSNAPVDLPKKTFPNKEARRNQILANLFDYCDADSVPTSDVDPASWGTTTPTYTGNELSYYINEIAVEIDSTLKKIPDNPSAGLQTNAYTMNVTLWCEALSYYNFPTPAPYTLDITVEASITCKIKSPVNDTWLDKEIDLSGTFTIDNPNPSASIKFGSLTASLPSPFSLSGANPADTDEPEIKDIDFNIKSIILTDTNASQNVDFAYINSSYSDKKSGAKLNITSTGHTYQTFSLEVDDCRQNLNKDDWHFNFDASNGASDIFNTMDASSTTNSIGLMNSESNPMAPCPTRYSDPQDYDKEDKPYTVCTAHIANSPMKSPMELGYIHRGAAWQTLNMDKYNPNGKMGAYRDGDANLYDQVKWTKALSEQGKVNVNSGNKDCLRALTMGISVTGRPLQPISPFVTAQTEADQLANAINGEPTRGTWNRRSEIAQVSALSDGSIITVQGLNDTAQEELIGKFINLCKAGNIENNDVGTMAYVIIYSQTIKDIGPPSGGSGITLNMDLDYDGNIGTADEVTAGFDINGDGQISNTVPSGFPTLNETITGCKKGSYQPYADKITSEAKIIGLISKNAITGKWELIRYEFANQ